jgi:hypothetical protein
LTAGRWGRPKNVDMSPTWPVRPPVRIGTPNLIGMQRTKTAGRRR